MAHVGGVGYDEDLTRILRDKWAAGYDEHRIEDYDDDRMSFRLGP